MDIVYFEKYLNKLCEKFPALSKKQIETICKAGLRGLYGRTIYNSDVIMAHKETIYFGKLFHNKKAFWTYRKFKLRIKYRTKYIMSRKKWDGKYYFGLSKEQYDLISTKKKRRKMRNLYFDEIKIYKLLEECELDFYHCICEFEYPTDVGFLWKFQDMTIRKYKPVETYNNGKKMYEPVSQEGK